MATTERYIGLCFPLIRVRYAGPTDSRGSRYVASLEGTRITRTYDDGLSASENAHAAARQCWEKRRAQLASEFRAQGIGWTEADDEQTRTSVLIPGDLSSDSYAFTVVPADYLGPRS